MSELDATAPGVRRARARQHSGFAGRVRMLWALVTEPRHMSVIYAVVYMVVTVTGIATLVVPPVTIAGALGPILSVAWALLFTLGGLLGMITVAPGWWKWERWSIALILVGIAIYGYVIAILHLTTAGSRLTQLGVLILAAAVFIVRWALIRGRTYGPRG